MRKLATGCRTGGRPSKGRKIGGTRQELQNATRQKVVSSDPDKSKQLKRIKDVSEKTTRVGGFKAI